MKFAITGYLPGPCEGMAQYRFDCPRVVLDCSRADALRQWLDIAAGFFINYPGRLSYVEIAQVFKSKPSPRIDRVTLPELLNNFEQHYQALCEYDGPNLNSVASTLSDLNTVWKERY